jgi:NAD(P)-dependent dehydrogenase (short-subunit alcohol dehydrogenase family)
MNKLTASLLATVLLLAAAAIPRAHAGEQIDIKGKVAVITGASRGIGLAVSQHLAKKGVKVLLTARSTNDLERESNALNAQGFETAYIKHDVTKPTDHAAAFAFAYGKWGRVDFVFANAGYAPLTTEDDIVKRALDINIYGVILTLNYALPYLQKSDVGAIVYCSSIASGFNAAISQATGAGMMHPLVTYTATKAAVDMVTRTSSALGIRTYGLNPGAFETAMLESLAKDMMGGAPIEATAGFNPVFKESVGNTRDLGPVVEAFF